MKCGFTSTYRDVDIAATIVVKVSLSLELVISSEPTLEVTVLRHN